MTIILDLNDKNTRRELIEAYLSKHLDYFDVKKYSYNYILGEDGKIAIKNFSVTFDNKKQEMKI